MIQYTLKEFLAKKNVAYLMGGSQKPPTIADISRSTKLNYRTIARIANNEVRRMDFEIMLKVMNAIRDFGCEVELLDLVREVREVPKGA